jgi:anti-sigma regulatory factor (Ser/Thr protein kinase)
MWQMKTFQRPETNNDQGQTPGYREGLLLMLALYSHPKWLSVVRGAVERLTETLGFPAAQCRSITRAVDEALTNIVRHSYRNRLDQPIAMYFRRAQRRG